jgi:pimeloyl-ACP methyl ester carboxylesterase
MVYALNLFNLIPGKEDQYRRYSVLAGKIIYGLGGRVIAAGQTPLRYMHGDVERRQMIVVEFPGEAAFQQFLDTAERQGIHELREGATKDYIWTLFAPWDMRAWVRENEGASRDARAGTLESRVTNQESRPHLVLLPGLLCDHALWEPQIAKLSGMCVPWVADLTRDDSIAAMAARVLAEAPAQQFALAGLSMGGYVAMEIMRRAPERVTRLALLDTRATLDVGEETVRRHELIRLAQTERGFTPITTRMLPLLVHPARVKDEPLVRVIREMAERIGVEAYLRNQQAIMARPDFRPELPRIGCPTLVLCGREDALTSLEMHEEMARLIPTARLVVIEQCGHLSTLERPIEVNTALRNWLAPDPLRML